MCQAKEFKRFKEEQKQEEKLVTSETKLEVDTKSLPKAERKRQLSKRLSDLYVTQLDKVCSMRIVIQGSYNWDNIFVGQAFSTNTVRCF